MGLVGHGNVAHETEGLLLYIYFILINFSYYLCIDYAFKLLIQGVGEDTTHWLCLLLS